MHNQEQGQVSGSLRVDRSENKLYLPTVAELQAELRREVQQLAGVTTKAAKEGRKP
jgi:hypothetical protein